MRAIHDVHMSASGHTVTIPHESVHSIDTKELFVAHYIGKNRTYTILDERHEKEATKRRRQVCVYIYIYAYVNVYVCVYVCVCV